MNGIVGWLLRLATQRWPESMREMRAREWEAEMHHLGHWGRLRFAWSLALSPPVNEDGVPLGWRETLPTLGRGLQPLLALFAGGLACVTLVHWIPRAGASVVEARSESPVPANVVSVAALGLVVVGLFFAGRWLGARLPVHWAHRGRLSRIGSAVVAPVVVISAPLAVHLLQTDPFGGDPSIVAVYVADVVTALAFWAACFTVVAALAVVVRRRGWMVAVLGTLVVLDLTAIVTAWGPALETVLDPASAPLWFPMALLDLENSGVRFGLIEQGFVASEMIARHAAMVVRPCLAASVFVLGYAFAARAAAPRPVPVRVPLTGATPRPALRGWLVAGAGLALWVYALTALTGALNDVTDQVGEHHIWAHEIRQAAILVMVTGLVLAVAGRGAAVLPAALALVALWAIDSAFDAADATDLRAAVLASGLAVIVLSGASQLVKLFATDEIAVRRTLAGFGVFGASCAPAVAYHWPTWETLLPTGFYVASAVVVGLLVFAALICAAAVRGRPMWIGVAAVAVVAGLASQTPLFASAGAPLAVIAVWFMRPRRTVLRRVLAMTAALIAAIPVGLAQMYSSFYFADVLMAAAGYIFPVDGLPFLPGAILLGTVAAIIIAAKVVPRERFVNSALEPAHLG